MKEESWVERSRGVPHGARAGVIHTLHHSPAQSSLDIPILDIEGDPPIRSMDR